MTDFREVLRKNAAGGDVSEESGESLCVCNERHDTYRDHINITNISDTFRYTYGISRDDFEAALAEYNVPLIQSGTLLEKTTTFDITRYVNTESFEIGDWSIENITF